MHFIPEDLLKLGIALLVGGIIGAEREHHKKAVGLRTLILISVGSALFTIMSQRIGTASGGDGSRIAANIVSGIGFLGAGVILEDRGRVTGLTTAATTWLGSSFRDGSRSRGVSAFWCRSRTGFYCPIALNKTGKHFRGLNRRTYLSDHY